MSIASNKMKPDLSRILKSKRSFRKKLAERPIVEKLRMLDALRERAQALRGATPAASIIVKEKPARYKAKKG